MRTRICQHCCHPFTVGTFARNRRTVRYCSETCRKRAERQRARARLNPTSPYDDPGQTEDDQP